MTIRVALFGATPDTPNMGVSALFASAIEGLTRELGDVQWVVFDGGLGKRTKAFQMSDGTSLQLTHFGGRGGHRYYRPENLATMRLLSQFGQFGHHLNEGLRLIDSCDAVLDVSGGDSFSDIYGWKRFRSVSRTKMISLFRKKPLILLPQTYGPYRDARALKLAESITCGASMTWARDSNSYEVLKSLLGSTFDPSIHRLGVDMAFGLAPRNALARMPSKLADWLAESPRSTPVVGINISGLIYNDPERARSHYQFVADYQAAMVGFVNRLLEMAPVRIVLIPHVMDRPGHYESDQEACVDVLGKVSEQMADRLLVAPLDLDQSEVKWLISRMDWFCGTRMHSMIAALSSNVPTAAVAYSDKTLGVFDTCNQGSQVFDPRTLGTDAVIDGLLQSFIDRDSIRESLAVSLPRVNEIALAQMRDIARHIRHLAIAARGTA
jgi:colanic acid/amylovoran biosynthesis protein